MLPFSLRPLGALARIDRAILSAGAQCDLFLLLERASNTPLPHHRAWCRRLGVDPERTATIRIESKRHLGRLLGRRTRVDTVSRRLAEWAGARIAALRGDLLVIFLGRIVALDPHATRAERLAPEEPWVWDAPETGPADPEQVGLPLIAERSGDRPAITSPYTRDQEDDDGGTRAERPPSPPDDGLDELVRLAEMLAQPLADGRPFRITEMARRRLAAIADQHGLDRCRSALEAGADYAVSHPVGWLDATLAAEPAPAPTAVEQATRACVPERRAGAGPRLLSPAEREQLAALEAVHGEAAVLEATKAAAGWSTPVAKITAELRRPPAKARPQPPTPPADRREGWQRRRDEQREAKARAQAEAERQALLASTCPDLDVDAVIAGWAARAEGAPPVGRTACSTSSSSSPAICRAGSMVGPPERCASGLRAVDARADGVTPNPEAEALWRARSAPIRARVTDENWATYFEPLVAVGLADGLIELQADDPFFGDWVRLHYAEQLVCAGAVMRAEPASGAERVERAIAAREATRARDRSAA